MHYVEFYLFYIITLKLYVNFVPNFLLRVAKLKNNEILFYNDIKFCLTISGVYGYIVEDRIIMLLCRLYVLISQVSDIVKT